MDLGREQVFLMKYHFLEGVKYSSFLPHLFVYYVDVWYAKLSENTFLMHNSLKWVNKSHQFVVEIVVALRTAIEDL